MDFRIADTFTDSLARLTGDEQKSAKTTAFDLQLNPANPGMQFHKLDKARDKNFWSVRVGRDIRMIVHKTPGSLLLCYVDHHDKAYAWAERRRIETHPHTGAAQLVEVRERVQEVVVPRMVAGVAESPLASYSPTTKPRLFAERSYDELLRYGVPAEWLDEVRRADEDSLLTLAERLPAEAAEALLELATGGKPRIPAPAAPAASPFEHPDAQRRFRLVADAEELERALEFPWDKWTVFLHPTQRELVEQSYAGPARIAGSAGTGKTIVALHRAVFLARSHPEARVLLTTFSDALANALQVRLRRLVSNTPRLAERIDVEALNTVGVRLYKTHFGAPTLATREDIRKLLAEAAAGVPGHKFSPQFLYTEWSQIVDAWQPASWEAYRDAVRLGRKTRLPESQREILWAIFSQVWEALAARQLLTYPQVFRHVTEAVGASKHLPYEFAVVDEAQDISVAQLRFLAALGGARPEALFFTGDLGQRIFQQPFSWKSLGVDIRGRSHTLRVNYRTSQQIRSQADRLLGPEIADVDGIAEGRRETVSLINGTAPAVRVFERPEEEASAVGAWLKERIQDGVAPHEIGVFVRSAAELGRARAAVEQAGVPYRVLDEAMETVGGHASVCSMHLAKGLEFRAVAVMACDDEVIPLQARIETVGDEADLQEVYDTERHLLYVACTRARDFLLVTGVAPVSEFLDDFTAGSNGKCA